MPSHDSTNEEMNLAWQFVADTSTSIFLTGKAGTGKTTFLRRLRESSPKRMVILAPTGVAAINAGGQTIHSFFQFPLGPYIPGAPRNESDRRFRMSQQKKNIIRTLDLLVIDEISMVRADLLDRIDDTLRQYRDRTRPFGGVQLLLIGDLMQLAPVTKDSEWQMLASVYDTPFFFSSTALRRLPYVTIELSRIYRQQDPRFISILAGIRDGHPDAGIVDELNSRFIPNFIPEGNDWIRLTTHNDTANAYNNSRLDALPGPAVVFNARIEGEFPETSYPTAPSLSLKKGAQVMFIKNDPDHAYFNGKIGTVTALSPQAVEITCPGDEKPISVAPQAWENIKYSIDPESKTITENTAGTFSQLPLRAAWAITVHKSQGLTFDHAVLDINSSFAHGQTYVALSRCRSLQGLVLTAPLTPASIIADTTVNSYIDTALAQSGSAIASLPRLRADYTISLLDDLYCFTDISNAVHWLIRVIEEHLYGRAEALLDELKATIAPFDSQIVDIACRFAPLYRREIERLAALPSDSPLVARIMQSCRYFIEKINEIYPADLLRSRAVLIIENKQTAQTYANALLSLRRAIEVKSTILGIMAAEPFSTASYLRAKARAILADEPGAAQARKRKAEKTPKALKPEKPKPKKGDSARTTLEMFRSGLTPEAIAATRALVPSTVYIHLSEAVAAGSLTPSEVIPDSRRDAILAAARALKSTGAPTIRVNDLLPALPGFTSLEIAFTLRHFK